MKRFDMFIEIPNAADEGGDGPSVPVWESPPRLPSLSDQTLLRLVRHNTWGNLRLLEYCGALSPERLEWTTPGTFGTLHRTLHHIVGAEHGYLLQLTGELPPIEVEGRGKAMRGGWAAPVDELTERAASNGERMERLVSSGFDPLRVVGLSDGTATAAIVAAQYIHHGTYHRAHVATILGAHGLEPPPDDPDNGWDVWGYGVAAGEVVLLEPDTR